ncbi:MAG: relaxase/mobilization nuclease domain-containing protein, partial [Gammaproteobacteria bacterium]|nr:relaxase/mobilization nuclease domain-containing protein [Gammaproteobacteria bacterium]
MGDKLTIIDSFEKDALFPGLSQDRYNTMWVEHQDKGRLELHFVVPTQELVTGKRLVPYFHRVDMQRVDTWARLQRAGRDLADPHHPDRERSGAWSHRLPGERKEAAKLVHGYVRESVAAGTITDRKSLVADLRALDFDITREGTNYISIRAPGWERSIRLKGGLYGRLFGVEKEAPATPAAEPGRVAELEHKFEGYCRKKAASLGRTYGGPCADGLSPGWRDRFQPAVSPIPDRQPSRDTAPSIGDPARRGNDRLGSSSPPTPGETPDPAASPSAGAAEGDGDRQRAPHLHDAGPSHRVHSRADGPDAGASGRLPASPDPLAVSIRPGIGGVNESPGTSGGIGGPEQTDDDWLSHLDRSDADTHDRQLAMGRENSRSRQRTVHSGRAGIGREIPNDPGIPGPARMGTPSSGDQKSREMVGESPAGELRRESWDQRVVGRDQSQMSSHVYQKAVQALGMLHDNTHMDELAQERKLQEEREIRKVEQQKLAQERDQKMQRSLEIRQQLHKSHERFLQYERTKEQEQRVQERAKELREAGIPRDPGFRVRLSPRMAALAGEIRTREEWLTNRDLVETKSLERGRPLPPDRLDYYATERTILAGFPPAHVMPAMEQAAKERHKEPTPYAFETLECVLGATRRQLDAKGLDPKLPGGMDKATYEQSLERALQDTKERCIEKGYSLRPDTLDRYAAELMFSRG